MFVFSNFGTNIGKHQSIIEFSIKITQSFRLYSKNRLSLSQLKGLQSHRENILYTSKFLIELP